MLKSTLLELFHTLSKKERKSLHWVVRSPEHNRREEVIRLFDYIDHHIDKDRQKLTMNSGFKAAFPGKAFIEKEMRYCMSFLLKCIEGYLVLKLQEKNIVNYQLNLSEVYRHRNLTKGFQQSLRLAQKAIEKEPTKALQYYQDAFEIEMAQYEYWESHQRTTPANLQELSKLLDLEYLARKLRQASMLLSHQAVFKIDYDPGLLQPVLDYLENNPLLDDHPAIGLYFFFYRAQTNKNHHFYFEKLKSGISRNIDVFPETEKRDLYLLAINYCIKQFNTGHEKYVSEVFELYREALERQILLENGRLSRFTFKNIVGIAIRLNELDWVSGFIHQYQDFLEPRYRENYVHYNRSKLLYAQKRFDEAMQNLQQVEYDDLFLNLDAKVMLLKIYYELSEFVLLESFVGSFQRFLQRKKLIGYHYENYSNIIRFTRKLLELNPYDKASKAALITEIRDTQALAERDWLLAALT